jgi:hypothetical protein
MKKIVFFLVVTSFLFSSCELFTYGVLGGADKTATFYRIDGDLFDTTMDLMSGVWYSHYAGIGRLDSYHIIRLDDFLADTDTKDRAKELFPGFDPDNPSFYGTVIPPGAPPAYDDYLVLYDDTVYGQKDDTAARQETWGFGYAGIVRAINIFNGDPNRGALIIEYLDHCVPKWLYSWGAGNGKYPFFGIYFRVINRDCIQMANAVDLTSLYNGDAYHTETKTLEECIEKNNVENEAEFISWGVVIPQDRE